VKTIETGNVDESKFGIVTLSQREWK